MTANGAAFEAVDQGPFEENEGIRFSALAAKTSRRV